LLLAWLAACGQAVPHQTGPHGAPVLRAVYRDAGHRLLVALPDGPNGVPHGDCAAPLLVDDATGAARQITPAEAAVRAQRMVLTGAVHGTCP